MVEGDNDDRFQMDAEPRVRVLTVRGNPKLSHHGEPPQRQLFSEEQRRPLLQPRGAGRLFGSQGRRVTSQQRGIITSQQHRGGRLPASQHQKEQQQRVRVLRGSQQQVLRRQRE